MNNKFNSITENRRMKKAFQDENGFKALFYQWHQTLRLSYHSDYRGIFNTARRSGSTIRNKAIKSIFDYRRFEIQTFQAGNSKDEYRKRLQYPLYELKHNSLSKKESFTKAIKLIINSKEYRNVYCQKKEED